MNVYLAKLKEKPVPSIKHKDGIQVFFASTELVSPEIDETMIERDEDGEIVADYNESDKKEVKTRVCKIEDGTKRSKLDRDVVMKLLKEKKIFAVSKKLLEKQSPEIEIINSVEEPKDETSVEEAKLPELPEISDDEEIPKGKTVVIKRKTDKSIIEPEISKENIRSDLVINGETMKKRLPTNYKQKFHNI